MWEEEEEEEEEEYEEEKNLNGALSNPKTSDPK